MIHPTKNTSTGHFGTRDDPAIRFRKFLDEMRLLRSLRPPRMLRLLSRLKIFQKTILNLKYWKVVNLIGNYSEKKFENDN